jgi:predicted secreted protein
MSQGTFYSIFVPFALALLTALVTFIMRNELPDGSARPLRQRLTFSAATFPVVLVLALLAAFFPTWFAVYYIVWWVTLFAVLPFGIRSQHETGEVVSGTEAGAPVTPAIMRKFIITTFASLVVFAVLMLVLYLFPTIL